MSEPTPPRAGVGSPAAAATPSAATPTAAPASVLVRLARKPVLTETAVGTPPPVNVGTEAVTVTIDGRDVTARKGQLIIDVADEAGTYIPRFCYHPRMKPVGMCRMCLVEVDGPRGPTLMPACYNPVSDGMKISTTSPATKKAQDGVLEFLLVNHPLDCPVCDKGGECPLQDQTLAYGPGESRFVEEKRHWDKPIPISELVNLDRERCIQCGRCVRFADEVAGDPLIDFYERGDKTEVAVFADDNPFSSYFSGNIVQICPVGALTATPYRFRARPWDLGQVESTCTSCSVGCRTAVQSSTDELVRKLGVDNDPVNWAWLCDKGRFDYQAVNSGDRLTVPMIRKGDELVETTWAEALAFAADGLAGAEGAATAVIGGARLPNEDAYAWAKLARVALGTDHVDAQLGDGLPADVVLGLPRATIDEAASAPLVITLGPDVKEELPIVYLRLRHAAREDGVQIVELAPTATGLSPYAAATLRYRPGQVGDLVAAVLADGPATATAGIAAADIEAVRAHLRRAASLGGGEGPSVVVVLGRGSLSESAEEIAAAAAVLAGIPGVAFLSALRRANVHGALDLGLAPGVLPGRVGLDEGRAWYEHHWSTELPAERGLDTAGILAAAAHGRIGALVLLGADPVTDFPDTLGALKGVQGARFAVAVDTFLTDSSRHADVVLPAATYGERRGTFTNLEGRISHLGAIVTAPGTAWPDWMIATELAWRMGVDLGFSSLEDIWAEIGEVSPLHQGVELATLTAAFGSDGVVVPLGAHPPATPRPRALDPMADPGIASAEMHTLPRSAIAAAATRNGSADNGSAHGAGTLLDDSEPAEPDEPGEADEPGATAVSGAGPQPADTEATEAMEAATDDAPPAQPPMLRAPPAGASPTPGTGGGDPDAMLLVTRRTLWDAGTGVAHAPSLAGLHPTWGASLHPDDLDRMGIATGTEVRVSTAAGSLVLAAHADAKVPPGTVVVPLNQPAGSAAELIGAPTGPVAVRVESRPGAGRGGSS